MPCIVQIAHAIGVILLNTFDEFVCVWSHFDNVASLVNIVVARNKKIAAPLECTHVFGIVYAWFNCISYRSRIIRPESPHTLTHITRWNYRLYLFYPSLWENSKLSLFACFSAPIYWYINGLCCAWRAYTQNIWMLGHKNQITAIECTKIKAIFCQLMFVTNEKNSGLSSVWCDFFGSEKIVFIWCKIY